MTSTVHASLSRSLLRRVLVVFALVLLDACSSSPEHAQPTTQPSAAPSASPSAGPSEPAPSAPEAPTSASSPMPTDDPTPVQPPDAMVQQMQMQLALDHPRVRPYLHVERAQNLPLTVYAVSALAEGASALTAADQPVRVVPEQDARVRFTARERLDGPRVRVRLAIPAEGVTAHVDLELRDYVWHAIDAEVVER